jgi:hypothetical protein
VSRPVGFQLRATFGRVEKAGGEEKTAQAYADAHNAAPLFSHLGLRLILIVYRLDLSINWG